MEELRKRIAEDLTDAIDGDVRVDAVTTALHATDASLYEIEPLAVVFPRTSQDVAAVAAYASDNGIPLIPRGAGTGLAGGAIGRGIVVEFARYMNNVVSVGSSSVRVQPGVVHADLNRLLRTHGRYFAPDPSNSAVTTIGGALAVDAAGSHAVRVGSVRDHVESLQCVLIGGQLLEFTRAESVIHDYAIRHPVSGGGPDVAGPEVGDSFLPPVRNESLVLSSLTPATRRADIVERLAAVLKDSHDLIRRHQPVLLRNTSGYLLRGLRHGNRLDLPRLLVGSEGTLAMFTEATLNTLPLPDWRGVAILMFPSMDAALQGMQLLLELEPSACDLLDRRLLSMGRDADSRFQDVIHPEAEAGLFLEYTGMNRAQVEARIGESERRLASAGVPHSLTRQAFDFDDVEFLWSLPSKVVSLLARLKGASRPLPFVEDIAVPPSEISAFLTLAHKTFHRHEVTATLYAHAASGQLHLRPILPVPDQDTAPRLEAIARDLYRHVKTVGGTISGEHGDGLTRTAFIRSQYGPLYRSFQQIKEIFDPQHLMNPDKIVCDDGQLTIRHLRRVSPASTASGDNGKESLLPVLKMNWSAQTAMDEAVHCNGCGTCRATDPSLRMCPFFHDQPAEEATPRSKASLLRTALSRSNGIELLSHPRVQQITDQCFNCKQCRLECPSGVDIPHLVQEARAQNVAINGLSKSDWLLSRFHTYARFASRFTFTANRLLRHRVFRRILQKTLGIAARRRLPEFASRPFLNSKRVLSEHNSGKPGASMPTVVYFVDYFANHHDPQLAEAFVRILLHNGFRVYIPPHQTVSGMAMISVGDLEAAREAAETNLRELGEPAREGYPIVCTEPTAALCLAQEYPLLLEHPDVGAVAAQAIDAGNFLWNLHQRGKLKTDFSRLELTLAYHTPCHVKALGAESGLHQLLKLIPGVEVRQIDKGCTGMAGTFGLAAEHFEQSLRLGRGIIDEMKTIRVTAGTTDCSSCRMQMEQEATIPTVHPLKILALAYGLMPDVAGKLAARPSKYVMS
ncbi:MAG: FAD-linked oxidase C-terminal domain-containing protein [Planctomycetaceae bacterium]